MLLCLDTATPTMRLSLWAEGQWVFQIQDVQQSHRYHSAVMIPLLQEAFSRHGYQPKALQGLVIHQGPGSFTGIRTGLVTARILAQFTGCALYPVNAFELLVPLHQKTTVLLDALRGNVYAACLTLSEVGVTYHEGPALLPLADAWAWTPDNGAVVLEDRLLAAVAPHVPPACGMTLVSALENTLADRMVWLVTGHGERLRQPWQHVAPLYLQAPNITQRKPQPGRLA